MTKLSVNINKFATLRNSRGGNNPDVVKAAVDAQRFGADGVTVHPRPDERHIRYADVYAIKKIITTEFNIEGNSQEQKFIDLVLDIHPMAGIRSGIRITSYRSSTPLKRPA
jgi:pyridoxine 5-phosphate synthase